MTEIILGITVTVLCILGVAEVLHILKQRLLTPFTCPQARLIVFLDDDTPDLQLASVVNECSWNRRMNGVKIIGVYSYTDKTVLENCRRIAKKHNIRLCPLEEAEDLNILNLL